MTTRKPKLNLLYVAATEAPWLQLAVVTPDNGASAKHAQRWQGTRSLGPSSREIPPPPARTIH